MQRHGIVSWILHEDIHSTTKLRNRLTIVLNGGTQSKKNGIKSRLRFESFINDDDRKRREEDGSVRQERFRTSHLE